MSEPRSMVTNHLRFKSTGERLAAMPDKPETELPDWDDLRGMAPDATGGLSSEAFVRQIRSEWR